MYTCIYIYDISKSSNIERNANEPGVRQYEYYIRLSIPSIPPSLGLGIAVFKSFPERVSDYKRDRRAKKTVLMPTKLAHRLAPIHIYIKGFGSNTHFIYEFSPRRTN